MKLTFATAVMIFTVLGISSCKKDYNCVCQYQILGVDQTDIHRIDDVKRQTAKDKCKQYEDDTQLLHPEATCDIE